MKVELTRREARIILNWVEDALAVEKDLEPEDSTDWADMLAALKGKLETAIKDRARS